MSTLMAVLSGKRVVGCCNAKCYDAKTSRCTCICGGANHGRGYVEAAALVATSGLSLLGNWCAEHPEAEATGLVFDGQRLHLDEKLLV